MCMTINVLVLIFGAILFNAYNGCQARSCALQAETYVEGNQEANSFGVDAEKTVQPVFDLFYYDQVESDHNFTSSLSVKLFGASTRSKISRRHKKITARGPPRLA